ncbi:MAG: ATP-grasp domain-containing protein [Bacillota bacterium]
MKLFEFEAKEICDKYNIPTPESKLVNIDDFEQLDDINYPVIIKSQILTGSRYKKGAIKIVENKKAALDYIEYLKNNTFSNEKANKILVEEVMDIKKEHYISITFDANKACPVFLISQEGGVNIEDDKESVLTLPVNILTGIQSYHIQTILDYLNIKDNVKIYSKVIRSLYKIYRDYDAKLVEINPLVITDNNEIVAVDGKMDINENSLYRQEFNISEERYNDILEYKAAKANLNYVRLDGNIGVLCTGAGLTLSTIDLIGHYGGKAANFLEFGGATYERASEALEIVLGNPNVEVLVINTFGLVARADIIAQGLGEAIENLDSDVPIVISIRGTGQDKAREILNEYGLNSEKDIETAVKKAISMVQGGM